MAQFLKGENTMKNDMTKICGLVVLLAGLSHPAGAGELKSVTYADIEAPQVVDITPAGPSLGDMYMRHGVKRSAPDGPVIGRYFTQAIIVFHDPEKSKVARSYFSEQILDDGSIYMTDMVETIHGRPVDPGHVHEGAVVGGTGKYAGIKGTYTVEVLDGGTIAKTTISYSLDD